MPDEIFTKSVCDILLFLGNLQKKEEEKEIFVHNVWHQEGGCSGGDGYSEVIFSHDDSYDNERFSGLIETEIVLPGQYLLITWSSNIGWSCCSGYNRAFLEVFDQNPEDDSTLEWPAEVCGDSHEYEIMSYEELLEECPAVRYWIKWLN